MAHLFRGDALTPEQIRRLPNGAEVVVVWDDGKPPTHARIRNDGEGEPTLIPVGAGIPTSGVAATWYWRP